MFTRAGRGLALVALLAAVAVASVASAQTSVNDELRPFDQAAAAIERKEAHHRAWLSLDLETARRQAEAVDASPPESPLRHLNGLVVAVKDNIDTTWLPTTAGSKALRTRQPATDATVVDRVLAAGGVIPGKTNMDTFARGVRTVSELGGQTRNALDPSKSPGGSSGGTAVAVALGQADVGIGTDTCGSLRYPAAYNGIYGLRPTPGLISRSGIIPLSATHDVVGPMARNPRDLALLLDVLAGSDNRDPATLKVPTIDRSYVDIATQATDSGESLRVGVIRDRGPYAKGRDGRTGLDVLRRAGLELVEVKLPNLGTTNVINEEFSVLKPKIVTGSLGESWLSGVPLASRTYQSKLAQMRTDSIRLIEFMNSNDLDAVVYPTTPYPAAPIGAPQSSGNCSLSASTGTPAMALPHPAAPIPGVDVLGRPFDEDVLLKVAVVYDLALSR